MIMDLSLIALMAMALLFLMLGGAVAILVGLGADVPTALRDVWRCLIRQ